MTLDLQYGETASGDGANSTVALTMGTSDDVSSAVISVSYTSQDEIFAGDREISKVPVYGCTEPWPSFLCGSSFPAYGRNFDNGTTLTPGLPGTDQADFEPWSNAARYNFAPVNYLQQPIERYNIFGKVSRDLSESVQMYGKLTYVKRTSVQQLAQVRADRLKRVLVRVGQQRLGDLGRGHGRVEDALAGNQIDADNYFNPWGENIDNYGLRAIAVGPRQPNFDYDTYGIQLGLKGEFDAAGRAFNWDLGGQRNDGQYNSVNKNYLNLFNLARALGPSYRDADGIQARSWLRRPTTRTSVCPTALSPRMSTTRWSTTLATRRSTAPATRRKTTTVTSAASSSSCRAAWPRLPLVGSTARTRATTSLTRSFRAAVARITSRNRPKAARSPRTCTSNCRCRCWLT